MRKKRVLLSFGLVACGCAVGYWVARARAAVPTTEVLTYSGVLTDTAGAPINGARNLQVQVWDAAMDGNVKCLVGPTSMNLVGGTFKMALPTTCTAAVQASGDLWVEVIANGESLGRTKLGAVPYALQAGHALAADTATTAAMATSSTPPTVTRVTDKRTGCPATAAINTDQVAASFNVAQPTTVEIRGHMIRSVLGRSDLNLILDGTQVTSDLTYTPTAQWASANLYWAGMLAPGAHSASLRSANDPAPNIWGCGENWGDITVIVH